MSRNKARYASLFSSVAMVAVIAAASPVRAQEAQFSIAPQPLSAALNEFSVQSRHSVIFKSDLADSKLSQGVAGATDIQMALNQLLAGTGLGYQRDGDTFIIVQGGSGPQSESAAGGGAEVEGLIVTAQKREENIQDVPIAMSAFSQETLEDRQVAGGPDLITQIPNFSFTKTNFTSYSIQIRGIGTQAISATTDPAVAVAFNNTPFVRNHFFEQEFYDLERLEVLRGPQGTLYGRNATAGVVNLISAKPKFTYEAKASVDIGNYATRRLEGMVNIPLVEDVVALRLAGAWTSRDGYATNQLTGNQIDGRDLWSGRVSLRFEPTDGLSANLVYEHFEEQDDRLRSGKQLCKKDPGPLSIGGIPVPQNKGGVFGASTYVSQGCIPVSLYSAEAFQTPNGFALPFYGPTGNLGNFVFAEKDPYLNGFQSRDLRVIESSVEPDYRAATDLVELQLAIDIGDKLTLNSETAFNADSLSSLQDYNRFTTAPGAFDANSNASALANRPGLIGPDGVFCDPQLGCSDRLLLVDLSTSESTQFSQEFRLGSDFDGPVNFSLGANFTRHDAMDKYYVFINSLTMFAAKDPQGFPYPYIPGVSDNHQCLNNIGLSVGDLATTPDPTAVYNVVTCVYIDPNPIGSLNDQGRNYFLSKNPYKLISYAAFGEVYYNLTADLKLTGGLRWTVDRKQAPQVPSWLLASGSAGAYPVAQTIDQEWREPTGRLALDWQPHLSFTDQTLLYASYAHGYKAGGANPPPPVLVTYSGAGAVGNLPFHPETFEAEFVDAFEVGSKNTLFQGAMTLNLGAFYYDYKGYQISQIVDRSAVNSNFDAEIWGLELEADWRLTDALRLGFKGGYQSTRMADGSSSIDLMDRTAGDPAWQVVRPFPTIPSNCILPVSVLAAGGSLHVQPSLGQISASGICVDAYYLGLDPITQLPYDPSIINYANAPKKGGGVLGAAYADYHGFDPLAAPSGGRGIPKDLSGNELPNAPNYTATVTADYTLPLAGDWQMTLHGDYHYQSDSWARVINSDPYDRIRAFSTVNAAAIITNDAGWKIMAYVKNVFDQTAITGAFLNSDDTGLTTNVFLTEPRLYGIRVTKDFDGGGWLGDIGRCDDVCPLTVEIGGGVSRFDGATEGYAPDWLDLYSATFPLDPSVQDQDQDQDLDWGDTRSVKLTYAPAKDWRASAAYRVGKTKGFARAAGYEHVPGGAIIGVYGSLYVASPDNDWRAAVRDMEEHTIADFQVGMDLGFGAFGAGGRSAVSAGLRYADFHSTSTVMMEGVPHRVVPPVTSLFDPTLPKRTFEAYNTSLDSDRDFEGVGPSITWDASIRLAGDEARGHADVDWSVTAGVLFGKQAMDSQEDRLGNFFSSVAGAFGTPTTTLYDTSVPRHRSDNNTVPNLSLSLGVSYSVDRVKISTGYAYDRFFDVIDGGWKDTQTFDRTIQGPFVKLSVGFGG